LLFAPVMNALISILLWVHHTVAAHVEPACEAHVFATDNRCQQMRDSTSTSLLAVRHEPKLVQTTANQSMADAEESTDERMSSAKASRIFCFAWTPRRWLDEQLMPAVRKELKMCDGHAFFTDVDAPGEDTAGDWIRVQLPPSDNVRSNSDWLNHRNMVAVAPVWAQIFRMDLASQYDWFFHVELDHFINMDQVRRILAQNLHTLRSGSEPETKSVDGSILLSWGNAFLFNHYLVHDMAANWDWLGAPIDQPSAIVGHGCPYLGIERVAMFGVCEQDMAYPLLPDFLENSMLKMGAEGCGKDSYTPSGKDLPLSCWQDNGWLLGDANEDKKLEVIRNIAALRGAKSWQEAKERCDTAGGNMAKMCENLYRAVNVPIMHGFKLPKMHELAWQLLVQ